MSAMTCDRCRGLMLADPDAARVHTDLAAHLAGGLRVMALEKRRDARFCVSAIIRRLKSRLQRAQNPTFVGFKTRRAGKPGMPPGWEADPG